VIYFRKQNIIIKFSTDINRMLKIQLQMRANNDTFDLIVVFYGFVNETNIGFGTSLTRDKVSRF
jgi:hypothetical protein